MDKTLNFLCHIFSIILSSPPILISIFALLFTIFSFWWMNWRKGKIIIGIPRTFAASAQGENRLLLVQLPLVFYNDGPSTYIVQNLRLQLEQNERKSAILFFNNTLSNLASNEDIKWAHQFALEGRKSYSSIFVFQRIPGQFTFSAGKCKAMLEGKLNRDVKWRKLLEFELQTPEQILDVLNSDILIPHDNDSDRFSEI